KINVRPGAEGEAIEIFDAAAKEEVVNLEVIYAIRRCGEIEQAAAAAALEFLSGGVIQHQRRVPSRINLVGLALDQDSLPFPDGELVETRRIRFGMAVDDCVQRNR